jgi:hypothetical protein
MKVAKVREEVKEDPVLVDGTENKIKLTNLLIHDIDSDPVSENICYEIYPRLVDFRNALLNRKNIWVVYQFEDKKLLNHFQSKEYQQRYEDIVCGFLLYYDREVRNGLINHSIYFHWGEWIRNKYSVVIFINEPPLRRPNNNPLYERDQYVTSAYYGNTKEVEPPNSQLSDPPKPPPPPPPY